MCSTLDYKWWARKYSKQRILLRLLQLELLKDLTPEERREIEEMVDGLRKQIERRKRDMEQCGLAGYDRRLVTT